MAKKKHAGGRPPNTHITPQQLRTMADALTSSIAYLRDTAKFMEENGLTEMLMPFSQASASTLHIEAFARKAFAEVGPVATAYQMGLKTRMEQNQERYQKYQKRKKAT